MNEQEFQNIYTRLRLEATDNLITAQKQHLESLQQELKNFHLEYAELWVRKHVFGRNELNQTESERLNNFGLPKQITDKVEEIKAAEKRLARLVAFRDAE